MNPATDMTEGNAKKKRAVTDDIARFLCPVQEQIP
jgi:hypothetical protein